MLLYAVKNISITVHHEDIFGIIGQSGAGKSTLLRMMSALESPSSGTVLFEGQDIHSLCTKKLRNFRKEIGMVFQHFNLFSSRTVAENIKFPLEIHGISQHAQKVKVKELLSACQLETKADLYPSQLSGGEKQRVGIARALALEPKLLFCDEATSALDPTTTKEILSLLKTCKQKFGLTIVLITHEMEVIKQICTKVAVLEKGHIVEQGFVSDLLIRPQHHLTKNFLQNSIHQIPHQFLIPISAERKLLRLCFEDKTAGQPIIARMIKTFDVEANILHGWIDTIQGLTVGNLLIELQGEANKIDLAHAFLGEHTASCEVIQP